MRVTSFIALSQHGPSLEGGDEGALIDQAGLKRERSEEEMAVCGGSHDMAPIV
jgi:hypothetical protein